MDFCEPTGLSKMMRIVQKVENREDIRREANLPSYLGEKWSNTGSGNKASTIGNSGDNKGNWNWPMRTITLRGTSGEEVRKAGPTKRLSDAEFQSRKEKGLCFCCNEKYSHDHKCKTKEQRELCMLVVMAENEEYEIIEEDDTEQKELNVVEVVQEEQTVVVLSINSVVGLSNPVTMKVKGKLQGKEIIILIDCGATHNFISESLLEELKINTKSITNYGVILGSGTAIKGKGVCEAIEMVLGKWRVVDDFLPLELGGVDAILGMQWLYSLGITEVDWKNLILTFTHHKEKVVIRGDPSLTKARVSLKTLMKSWGEDDQGFLVECRALERRESLEEEDSFDEVLTVEESVTVVLKSFEDVFD